MKEALEKIVEVLRGAGSVVISWHIDPDGDAVGSGLAIYSCLKRLGKSVKVISEDVVPENLRFLQGSGEVLEVCETEAEVAVVVDSATLERLGSAGRVVRDCGTVINIDHHKSNNSFGDINLVRTDTGACGEIMYGLLKALGGEPTEGECEALYTAILSDSGCFRFPTTTPDTLMVASRLLDGGARPYHIATELFWNRSPEALGLLSRALSTIEITDCGAVATMEVTREMYRCTGGTARDTEGLANHARSIRDVIVGVLLRETDPGSYRVSLRAREGFTIDDVARSFGGGGHPTAAGFRIQGELGSIKERIREAILASITDAETPSA
jgi:phosphoesterase RecJ-like protein